MRNIILAILITLFVQPTMAQRQRNPDTIELGKALEYFTSGKYHESLLIFQRLDKEYDLNPRFRAYIGLCYYYEWDYAAAVKYFDKVLPELDGLAPHERSVYYYAAGESYFQLKNYDKAEAYFQRDLEVCYDREKGDVLYRIGLCQMFRKQWQPAKDSYVLADQYYRRFRNIDGLEARLAQIANMINGCQKELDAIAAQRRADSLRVVAERRADSLRDIAANLPADTTLAEAIVDSSDSVVPQAVTDSVSAPVITPPAVVDEATRPDIPVEDNPEKRQQEQRDTNPVNLQDIFEDSIEVKD